MSDGTNPLRWDCVSRGCFNRLCRPKIELFAACFPGRIAMSDIDATVEVIDQQISVNAAATKVQGLPG